jgi:EAL domain-containing protein (putative c-di-GMP-specific phosphodiesterase class I)/CheY-like chemotaxis protein
MSDDVDGPAKVVVVDDDPMVAATISDVVRRRGDEVLTFHDPKAALEALASVKDVDAIVSDVSMPGMSGLEMLTALRSTHADVPVVLLTGAPRVEDAMRAMELGVIRYLAKPLDAQRVREVVGEAVRWGRLMRTTTGGPTRADRASLDAAFTRASAALKMVYQPIVSITTRRPSGFEALMRSSEPTLPNPPAVLDAAERLGRLHSLGRQLRGMVASQLRAAQPFEHAFFVNLHSSDLADPALYDAAAPLSAFASSVVLEITERASLEGVGEVESRIESLRKMGYRIAVDDLGAGYAGLSYFARVSPDIVKIDMSLTRGVDVDPVKRRVVGSICALAHDLDMLIVAEGIETEGELGCVRDLGADLVQGYLIAKPGPYARPGTPAGGLARG